MSDFIVNIGHNITALLSLTLLVVILRRKISRLYNPGQVALGLLFGGAAVYTMLTAYVYQPGMIFDCRTIVIQLAGFVGGPIVGILCTLMAGAYRVFVGGTGTMTGVLIILVAGVGGIVSHSVIKRKDWPPKVSHFLVSGFITHVVVLLSLLTMPPSIRYVLVSNMALPLLGIFPLVIALIGYILSEDEKRTFNLRSLKHSESLFHDAQVITRFGSWEFSLKERRFVATSIFFELFGFRDDQPMTVDLVWQQLQEADRSRFAAAFERLESKAEAIDEEGQMVTPDGREIWVRLVGRAEYRRGKVTHLVGNLIDISRRKKKEIESQVSQKRLQAILDNTDALICICDLTATVTLANQRFSVFGVNPLDMVDKPLYELLPRGRALEQWIDDYNLLVNGQKVVFKQTLRHIDGTDHTYMTSKFLLSTYGAEADAICYVSTDVSELEETLSQRKSLAKALTAKNVELERFSYSVSHDIKGPLLTISSFTQILAENLKNEMTPETDEAIGYIRLSVEKIKALIEGLLELSKVGKSVGEPVSVDLGPLFTATLSQLEAERFAANATLEIAQDVPAVAGDPLRLGQVIQNLLQNAFRYAREDGLHVAVTWTRSKNGDVVVAVADNGRGVDAEILPTIFEPFTKSKSSGTGFGLALVKEIMHKHGGSVWAESPGEGQGTTFFLRFRPAENLRCNGLSR